MADRVAADDWVPAVWSHAAVVDMQARLDPVRMARYADDWQLAVDRLRDVLVELNRQVAAQVDPTWRGRGASAALDALGRYVAGSVAGLPACRSVAVHLLELSRAAGDLRAVFDTERLDRALAQIRQIYSAPAVAAGNAVDDIPPPPDPFTVVGPTPGAAALPSAAQATTVPAGVQAQAPTAPITSTPWPEASPAPRAEPGWHSPIHSAALSSPAESQPARSDLSAMSPAPASPPVGAAPSVAARPTPSLATPFVGGMYPGHWGRDDGGEHRVPKYLISAGNANELIGELPLVAPPVIGE